VPFFKDGFERKEKCMYIFDQEPPHPIYSEFDHVQTHPEDLSKARQMEIYSFEDTYTRDGVFNAERMIQDLKENAAKSKELGYNGLRVAGEMSWAVSNGTPVERLIEYEVMLDAEFPDQNNLAGICQYDETQFSPHVLIDIIRTHPYLIIYGKLYQNKYFYTNPKFFHQAQTQIRDNDYKTILSIIMDDGPLAF
jgi:hypothetical protein